MKLTEIQQRALEGVAKAKANKVMKEEEFDNWAKEARNEFLNEVQEELKAAVRNADLAQVPRTQIGYAMGTKNYRTVQEILSE